MVSAHTKTMIVWRWPNHMGHQWSCTTMGYIAAVDHTKTSIWAHAESDPYPSLGPTPIYSVCSRNSVGDVRVLEDGSNAVPLDLGVFLAATKCRQTDCSKLESGYRP